jgi:hypothetical protein
VIELEAVDQFAMPRQKTRTAVDIAAREVRVLVNIFLLVPVSDALRINLSGVQLQERVKEACTLLPRDGLYVSPNPVA